MPKQTFKIEGFHGGLNSNSDPRDIRDNESPSLKDVAIDSVGKIKTLGSFNNGNVLHSGTAQSGASTTITLASGASGDDDRFNNYSILLTGGTGSGQLNIITDYVGSSKVATVSSWSTNPDNTTTYEIIGDANAIAILQNRGLFVVSSDRKVNDGAASNETLIFCYDTGGDTIDVKDSAAWNVGKIAMGGDAVPIYYAADGVVRVSDFTFVRDSQWFGYIDDVRLDSLGATGPAANWFNVTQSLAAPTSGKCLISNPEIGSDTNGINSSAGEYIGSVINNGTDADDVVEHSAVNLRVGLQYEELLANTASGWDYQQNHNTDADATASPLKFLGNNNVKMTSNGNANFGQIGDQSLSFTITESECMIFGLHVKTAEYDKLGYVIIQIGESSDRHDWRFPVEDLKPDCWNLLVCSPDNVSSLDSDTSFGSLWDNWIVTLYQNGTTGTGGDASPTFHLSGPVIANNESIDAFQPGSYTFHYTYLYDAKNKQESLPFKFNDVDEDGTLTDRENLNKINIAGAPVLLKFDAYICSNVSTGDAYAFNQRISGSRLYWKVEENDNYFLIGELDFVSKGFKWIPESDTDSYSITNTTNTTAPILSRTAIVKGISPSSANTIDTFKTINGFSSEVNSLDAQYKTAVVHGRRAYIGNIKQDNKTHPDRILKSQVNRFDTFPQGMGSVDVVIRDGESIVKLEAYADRILQFKQHSLYIINVSESVDFLEDTYRNKGCAFDYHVTRTDMGIVWFNDHGCYLYNGKTVLDLLEKQGIRLISEEDWEAFVTDGVDGSSDDTDMSSAMIGYVPKKKHLIIKNENNDIYLYDFVLQSWTTGIGKITETTAMTNFALDGDQNLFYIDNTTTVRKTWQTSAQTSTGFEYITPDIDFGQPGVRKKVYKVYVTYKSGATTNVQVDYDVNGGTTFPYDFANGDNFTSNELGSASGWQVAELKPDNATESNNIKSFQLRFATDGTVPSGFEINDITIVYRLKNIK